MQPTSVPKRTPEKLPPPGALLVAVALLLPCAAGWADEDAEIVMGCHLSIGEFGYEAINMCIRENRAAREEVQRYPPEVQRTVARCSRRFEPGWVLVKRCIDADLAAATALEAYASEHGPTLDACRNRLGGRGDAAVRECVEQAIEAENSGDSR
ncbi:MAG: hypothetical protein ACREU7_07300 [Burkholderiales bacterium]